MPRRLSLFAALSLGVLSACATSPIVPLPPKLPLAFDTVTHDATNARGGAASRPGAKSEPS